MKPVTQTLGQTVGAVTGAVKPVTQTVGALTGAVKPVTQTVGSVVHATQPVSHVVTSLGSLLDPQAGGLGGFTVAQHQQTNPHGFGLPLRSLIGSWTQAFARPFAGGRWLVP